MLKNNFVMAKNASEPLEISQDFGVEDVPDPGAAGNAFAGDRANADNEMHHALRGAIMSGNENENSSIANVGMLTTKFGSAATKSEKDTEKSRAAYMQVMNQQLQNMRNDLEAALNGMRERQGELEEQLDSLTRLRNLVNDGDFDPTNADHLALYNSAFDNDPEMSAADFVLQTQSRQNDLIDGTEAEAQAEYVEITENITVLKEGLDSFDDAHPEYNDAGFVDENWEMARQNAGYSANISSYSEEEWINLRIEHLTLLDEQVAHAREHERDNDGITPETEQTSVIDTAMKTGLNF